MYTLPSGYVLCFLSSPVSLRFRILSSRRIFHLLVSQAHESLLSQVFIAANKLAMLYDWKTNTERRIKSCVVFRRLLFEKNRADLFSSYSLPNGVTVAHRHPPSPTIELTLSSRRSPTQRRRLLLFFLSPSPTTVCPPLSVFSPPLTTTTTQGRLRYSSVAERPPILTPTPQPFPLLTQRLLNAREWFWTQRESKRDGRSIPHPCLVRCHRRL